MKALRQGVKVGAIDAADLLHLVSHGVYGEIDSDTLESAGYTEDELSCWLSDWNEERAEIRRRNLAIGRQA